MGKINPGSPSFLADLDQFASHPRFCGIRCGASELLDSPSCAEQLRSLAERDLQLDFAGGPDEIQQLLAVFPAAPTLRVVINHMGSPIFEAGAAPDVRHSPPPRSQVPCLKSLCRQAEWAATMRSAAEFKNVWMKVSGVFEAISTTAEPPAPTELDAYRPHLDLLWDCFGAERLVYGSNWPVCNRCGDPEEVYAAQLDVLTEWAAGKGAATVEGLFWRNALEAYRYDDSREHA